jgi:hypothetical protein
LNLASIAAQTTLFALDEVDLLRLNASRQPDETADENPICLRLHN